MAFVFGMVSVATAEALDNQVIDTKAAVAMIDERGVDPLAGIWQTGGGDALIAFIPQNGNYQQFDIVLLDSHDMSVIPGRVIGHARSSNVTGTYDATFSKSSLHKTVKVIIRMDKNLRLTFQPYKQKLSLSLWRLLPYMFRNPVKQVDTRPSGVDGAVRLYPNSAQEGPVML